MWLKFSVIVLGVWAIGAAAWGIVPWFEIQRWAIGEQRTFQNVMARALRSIQAGNSQAAWTLCSATAAYGFFHALGPGHGKVLIGGASLAGGATLIRLSILTFLSSLAQAATAIILVGGLYFILQIGSADLTDLTETWLAPASYLTIAAIGAVLIFRGARSWYQMSQVKQATHGCCGHAHGPSVNDVATLTSTRDAVALIASMAIRPCTGALFVLVISARFDAFAVGCLAVVTMGLGTAIFNQMVATSGVAARWLIGLGARNHKGMQAISATLHLTVGFMIIALSIGMLLP